MIKRENEELRIWSVVNDKLGIRNKSWELMSFRNHPLMTYDILTYYGASLLFSNFVACQFTSTFLSVEQLVPIVIFIFRSITKRWISWWMHLLWKFSCAVIISEPIPKIAS